MDKNENATKIEIEEMIPVSSSQMSAIGHDPNTDTLAIQFPTKKSGGAGALYYYASFPLEDFERFLAAESKGKFFIANIKSSPSKYPYTKVS